MGGELSVFKPKEVVRILNKLGFVFARQKDSHQQLRHPDGRATTVPMHSSRDLSLNCKYDLSRLTMQVTIIINKLLTENEASNQANISQLHTYIDSHC
jgi:predicted RNA binding protein YcfA (HicA-like mRNA interferase family)